MLLDKLRLEHEELRQSQVQLEVARDHYEQLYDFAPVGYLTLDRAGSILGINETGAHILGRSQPALCGLPLISSISAADHQKYMNHLRLSAQRREGCITTELRLRSPDNHLPVWVELISAAASLDGKRRSTIKCAFTDVSARKRAEESLRDSEDRFRNLADSAPVLIWISGLNKECTYLNGRWLEFTGRPRQNEIANAWTEGIHPEDLNRCLKVFREAFDVRKEFKMEYRRRRFDGEYRWLLDHGVPNIGSDERWRGYIGSCVDITERKEMENALALASRLPRENPSPVMRLKEGRIVNFANPAARSVMVHWRAALGDEAPATIVRTAVQALAKNESRVQDLAVADRQYQVWFAPFREACYVNLYFSDISERKQAEEALRRAHDELEERVLRRTRELTRATAVLQDEIAARKQTEHALRESEERFRLVIEGTREHAIIMLDTAGRVASWNTGAEQIQGYKAKEICGRHFSCFYPRAEIQSRKPQRLLEEARTKGRAEYEGWRVRKDRSRFWANVNITSLYDTTGRLRGYSKITRDMTERRRTQEALRLSERNLADFFDQSPLGLLWVNRKGEILRMNKAGLELIGCRQGEGPPHMVQEFHADPDALGKILKTLACGKVVHSQRVRIRRKDGVLRHGLIDANGLWERGRMIHSRWFVRDITRQMELEREVLSIAERERQRFGHDLHDDLCQQLTGIEFLSQTLAGQLAVRAPGEANRAREIAQMVRNAIEHTRDLAHGLSPTQLETLGLPGALEELAQRTRKVFKVDCRFRGNLRAWIHDPTLGIHLYRIAQEAVSNALQHGKARCVEIGLARNKYRLVLAVKDNGMGLPPTLAKSKGAGLRVMQYRAGVINGTLIIQRNRNGGTTVACSVSDAFAKGKLNPTL